MVNQRYHGADVLAEIGQREGGIRLRQRAELIRGLLAPKPTERLSA
jgi:hypothetical protein